MSRRRRAREIALQLLFQRDLNADIAREVIEQFAVDRLHGRGNAQFALELFDGVVREQSAIDPKITDAAENWELHRMPAVDRNVLRIGVFELLYDDDTPPKVAIDEAIEIARRYGSKDSSSFVNGILDRIMNVEPD